MVLSIFQFTDLNAVDDDEDELKVRSDGTSHEETQHPA